MITDIHSSTIQLDQGLRQVAVKLAIENLQIFCARNILNNRILKHLPNFVIDLYNIILHNSTASKRQGFDVADS
jgi:hypothetical protein